MFKNLCRDNRKSMTRIGRHVISTEHTFTRLYVNFKINKTGTDLKSCWKNVKRKFYNNIKRFLKNEIKNCRLTKELDSLDGWVGVFCL
jgi:hypothetical protein